LASNETRGSKQYLEEKACHGVEEFIERVLE
jgi:hypothetical protein